MYVGLMIDLIL